MISLDGSILAALVIFLGTAVALNYLLFRPLLRVQAEREARTTGLVTATRKRLDHQAALFGRYEAAIKQARMEAYRRQELSRAEALSVRAGILDQSRREAEDLLRESRETLRGEVMSAKERLAGEAAEIARVIAAAVLQRAR